MSVFKLVAIFGMIVTDRPSGYDRNLFAHIFMKCLGFRHTRRMGGPTLARTNPLDDPRP